MPAQKNCVASVAMKEGMPSLATSTPLMKPTMMPAPSPARTAIQPRWYSLKKHREDEAGEADDCREAEVDLAGADDEGQTDGEQDQRRQRRQEGGVDEGRQEHLRRRVHEQGKQQREDQDDRQAFDRGGSVFALGGVAMRSPAQWCLCCSSMRYSVSSATDMSFGEISVTIRPRSRTIRRSATSCTCARLCSI